jgi:hypothetical protein
LISTHILCAQGFHFRKDNIALQNVDPFLLIQLLWCAYFFEQNLFLNALFYIRAYGCIEITPENKLPRKSLAFAKVVILIICWYFLDMQWIRISLKFVCVCVIYKSKQQVTITFQRRKKHSVVRFCDCSEVGLLLWCWVVTQTEDWKGHVEKKHNDQSQVEI